MKRFQYIVAVAVGGLLPVFAAAGPAEKPGESGRAEVLVLGVYHMANPGQDIFNMRVDDVRTSKRQAEIAEVIGVLKKFRPTKIALERNAGDQRIAKNYASYLAGKHGLSQNEIEQLGFRLARELNHKTVYPTDADGDFPYHRLVNYAKASGRSKELDAIMAIVSEGVKADSEYLASHTVLEMLLRANSDERIAGGLGLYARMARIGEPEDWAGADLASDWYRRNMRIYSNTAQLANSSNDRLLVIFGWGHASLLQQAFGSDPGFRLRKLSEFTK